MPQNPRPFDPEEFHVPAFDPNEFGSPAPSPARSQPSYQQQAPESSYLEDWNDQWINRPLSRQLKINDTQVFDPRAAAEYYDDPAARSESQWKIPELDIPGFDLPDWMQALNPSGGSLRSLGAGMLEGAGSAIEGFTTPLNLATAGAAKTAGSLAKSAGALEKAGKTAEAARRMQQATRATQVARGLSVPVMGTGATRVGEGIANQDWMTAGLGLTELGAGALGAKMPVPRSGGRPAPIEAPPAAAASTLADLPLRPAETVNQNLRPSDIPIVNRPYEPADYAMDNAYIRARGGEVTPEQAALADPNLNQRAAPIGMPPEFQPDIPVTHESVLGGTSPKFDIAARPPAAPPDYITPTMRQGLIERGYRDTEVNTISMADARAALEQPPPPPIERFPARNKGPREGEFDPSTLEGLEHTEPPIPTEQELQFVNPETGEIKPASQAQPGDVPITEQLAAKRASKQTPRLTIPPITEEGMPVKPPSELRSPELNGLEGEDVINAALKQASAEAKPAAPKASFGDWVKDLAKGESGEFNLDAFGRRVEEGTAASEQPREYANEPYLEEPTSEQPPARRLSRNEVSHISRENREFVTRMDDEALANFIERQSQNPNYDTEVGRRLLDWARDTQDMRASGEVVWQEHPSQAVLRGEVPYRRVQQAYESTREPTPNLSTGRPHPTSYSEVHDLSSPELAEFVRDADNNYSHYGQGVLRERTRRDVEFPWERDRGTRSEEPATSPARPRPKYEPLNTAEESQAALDRLDANKRTPALERLGKIIGEDRASKLASGEVDVRFDESPIRVAGKKKLSKFSLQTWSNWADDQLKNYDVDAGKPGLTVEPHPVSDIFPDAVGMVYRDSAGKPIGMLKTDLTGTGISTLAVDSKLGLRRGKVAFELLKEAFDRGIKEPSGSTSDLTKNLIERVKRLAKADKGEINLDVVYEKINKLLEDIKDSKVGEVARKAGGAVGRFLKDEGGHVDLTDKTTRRLKELYDKRESGSNLTTEEMAEAKRLAAEYRNQPVEPLSSMRGPMQIPGKPIKKPQYGPTKAPRMGPAPLKARKPAETPPPESMAEQIWNAPRTLQSIDLPGITSAALRQSRPLAFSRDWFKAWGKAVQAFGSDEALKAINADIKNSKYFRPKYEPVYGKNGIKHYKELPSVAEELGVSMTDVLNHREEVISSSLAEKIPGYGRYIKASNRAYTGFLNSLRKAKFEQLMDGAIAQGRDPRVDTVVGKKLADFVNNATGRGSLKFAGDRINLEPIAKELGMTLYSPRALSARLSFMNPFNYTTADPLVRVEYWKSLARIGASWGAFSGLASLMPGVKVSTDANSADFGKIRIGNTRIDPGAGFQQLLVLSHRELPAVAGGGGTTSTTAKPGERPQFTPFGSTPMSATRRSLPATYAYNQLSPPMRFIADMLGATSKEPFDLTDRTLQMVLPMYAADIAEAAKGDPAVAEFFAPLLSSMGAGVQTYEKGDFNKPKITPFIKQVTGVDLPTMQIGR